MNILCKYENKKWGALFKILIYLLAFLENAYFVCNSMGSDPIEDAVGCTPLTSVVCPKKVFNFNWQPGLNQYILNARTFVECELGALILSLLHYLNAFLHILSQIEQQFFCIYNVFPSFPPQVTGIRSESNHV